MNIDINELFQPMTDIIKKIGAIERPWQLPTVEPHKVLSGELNADELQGHIVKVDNSGGKIFVENNQQFIIYIPYGTTHKFHVADCATIQQMKGQGRYRRYIRKTDSSEFFKTTSTDGYYGYSYHGYKQTSHGSTHHVKLDVCMNCLSSLNYKNFRNVDYHEQSAIVSSFSIAEFFAHYRPMISTLPTRTDRSLLLDDTYTGSWSDISELVRSAANWTCQECFVNLADHPKLLHVHHINGDKQDNRTRNLEVLCVLCHNKQPRHPNIPISEEDEDLILKRQEAIRYNREFLEN